jgi:hypothetical protein
VAGARRGVCPARCSHRSPLWAPAVEADVSEAPVGFQRCRDASSIWSLQMETEAPRDWIALSILIVDVLNLIVVLIK